MKKTTCQLWAPSSSGDSQIDWPCYETDVPGLVVHRSVDYAGGDRVNKIYNAKRDSWAVSHRLSGHQVIATGFRTRQVAVRFAESIADLANWTRPAEELVLVPELYKTLWSIATRLNKDWVYTWARS